MNTNTTTRGFARYIALPIVSAGIIGGAALGLAGVAGATPTEVRQPNIVATPTVTAPPAPEAVPGWHWHHGIYHLHSLESGYTR